MKAPKPTPDIVSNRDRVSYRTAGEVCSGCHKTVINPHGFAFEGFDAVGRFTTEENGAKVDASGATELDGEPVTFTGAREFLEAAAEAEQTHGCYVDKLSTWVLGRPLAAFERKDAAPIADRSARDSASVRALLTALLTSSSFRSVVREDP